MESLDFSVEEEDGILFVESEERDHTVMNLVRKNLWAVGVEAGYEKGHPYVGASRLVVKGDNPEKALKQAVEKARNDLKEFDSAFDNAL
jgi:DNA-directed RNA polymerase subunit L